MVDFQSRDRRTRGRDDEDDAADEDDVTETPSDEDSTGEESTDPEPDEGTTDDETSASPSRSAGVAVVTVADDRTVDSDPAGDAVVEALDGHELVTRELLGRSHDTVQGAVDALVGRGDVDAVVTVGATGVDDEDVTIEAVHPLFEKAMPGFGELFRRRYHESVGTDVIATRATAGIADGTPVFCLPGSAEAARLGTSEIVAEQVGRLGEPGDDPTA